MTEPALLDLLTTSDRDGFLAELAATGPVGRCRYFDGSLVWLVTGYEECRTVLTDPRFSSDIINRASTSTWQPRRGYPRTSSHT